MLNAENAQMLISKNFGINASEKAKITCVTLDLSGKTVSIVSSGDLVLQGKNVKITGETVAIEGGAKVEVHAALIKLN